MVSGVIQKLDEKENLRLTREHLSKRILIRTATTTTTNENHLNSSLSFPVLNNSISISHESSLNLSNSSLGISSSKNNDINALRENFQLNRSTEKSLTKFRVSESNLVRHNSMPNPGILKAKRQISF
jgi:CRISPR/Cas system endoribonuclease Cas6 (RAMP superfamily)